jgi:hypothetical protein
MEKASPPAPSTRASTMHGRRMVKMKHLYILVKPILDLSLAQDEGKIHWPNFYSQEVIVRFNQK